MNPIPSELEKVGQLRKRVQQAGLVPADASDVEFLSDVTYLRYLRARGLDLNRAFAMLSHSLEWRQREKPREFVCHVCRANPRSHTMRCVGRDLAGRPVFYSHFAGAQNLSPEDNAKHLVWMLENCFTHDMAEAQSFVWIVDFIGFGLGEMNPAMGSRALKVFAEHYPERLGQAILLDAPTIFYGLWRMISPLLDVTTRSKMTFISRKDRHALFGKLFDDHLVEVLDEQGTIARDPKLLSAHNWWTSAAEPCPSINHADALLGEASNGS